MHQRKVFTTGKDVAKAEKALIMLHGRGASAFDILGLKSQLKVDDFAILAPQATNSAWYPYSFLEPVDKNQPWLNSALEWLKDIVENLQEEGIQAGNIYLLGFSQGACLSLEFAARNAFRFGGVVALTGGLIGETIDSSNYSGNFKQTPVYISTGNPDPHIPVERVHETVTILKSMNARVTVQVFDGKPHNVSPEEIEAANKMIFNNR